MFFAEVPEQIIFVVVMLVIAAIKALGEKFGNKGQQADKDYPEYEESTVETDYEEYARQLRERQAEILARQQAEIIPDVPPPLPSFTPEVVESTYVTPVVRKPTLSEAEQKALENFRNGNLLRSPKSRALTTTARARARKVLASPYAARDAIVLSEILGPPKGQRI